MTQPSGNFLDGFLCCVMRYEEKSHTEHHLFETPLFVPVRTPSDPCAPIFAGENNYFPAEVGSYKFNELAYPEVLDEMLQRMDSYHSGANSDSCYVSILTE